MDGAADVVILPDADAPGLAHARAVADSLRTHVQRVAVVDPAVAFGYEVQETHGRDVSDWLAADHTRGAAELAAVLDAATIVSERPETAAADDSDRAQIPGLTKAGLVRALAQVDAEIRHNVRGLFMEIRSASGATWEPSDAAHGGGPAGADRVRLRV